MEAYGKDTRWALFFLFHQHEYMWYLLNYPKSCKQALAAVVTQLINLGIIDGDFLQIGLFIGKGVEHPISPAAASSKDTDKHLWSTPFPTSSLLQCFISHYSYEDLCRHLKYCGMELNRETVGLLLERRKHVWNILFVSSEK